MKLRTLGFGVLTVLLGSMATLPAHAETAPRPLFVLVTSLGDSVTLDAGRSVQMKETFLITGGKMLHVDSSITHTDNIEATISNCKVSNGFMFGSIPCMANVTRLSGGPASYGVKVVVQGQNGVSVATSVRTVTESAPAPTPTPSPTVTVTASPEPTPTPSSTPTVSASPEPTQTATPTSEPTRTSSPSPKPTDSD